MAAAAAAAAGNTCAGLPAGFMRPVAVVRLGRAAGWDADEAIDAMDAIDAMEAMDAMDVMGPGVAGPIKCGMTPRGRSPGLGNLRASGILKDLTPKKILNHTNDIPNDHLTQYISLRTLERIYQLNCFCPTLWKCQIYLILRKLLSYQKIAAMINIYTRYF